MFFFLMVRFVGPQLDTVPIDLAFVCFNVIQFSKILALVPNQYDTISVSQIQSSVSKIIWGIIYAGRVMVERVYRISIHCYRIEMYWKAPEIIYSPAVGIFRLPFHPGFIDILVSLLFDRLTFMFS